MRIIAGRNRGRRLKSPRDGRIRPTSDRARESLFNIIGPRITGACFLDLFTGTGAVGLEAASRGASFVLMVDISTRLAEANIEICGEAERCRTLRCDLGRGLAPVLGKAPAGGFDLVFLDPPYESGHHEPVLAALAGSGLMAAGCLVIAEARSGTALPEKVGGLVLSQVRRYGENSFGFYQKTETRSRRTEGEAY